MFDRLIKLVRQEEVSLFIGAGFSLKAGMPSVSMLKKAILNELDENQRKEHESDGLDELSEYFVQEICNGSRNSLIRLLEQSFDTPSTNMEDHKALAKIPHFHYLLTTNYDTLLEESYKKLEIQVIRSDKDCALIDNKRTVTILKIHGDFTDPDSIVITTRDYKDTLSHKRNPEMWKFIESNMLTKNIAFIGYSLRDNNVLSVINSISKAVKNNRREMFLIAPNVDEADKNRLHNLHVLYYDANAYDFLKELTNSLKRNIVEDYKHHHVSTETFARFCHFHDIDPAVSPQEIDKDNVILDFTSSSGKPIMKQISFTISKETYDKIEERNFEKEGVPLVNSPFPNIPLIPIKMLNDRNGILSMNGIVIDSKIEKMWVGPMVRDFPLTFIIPSRNFFELIHTRTYNIKKGKCVIEFDGESYKAKMEVTATPSDNGKFILNVQINFKQKEFYTDNMRAIRMIDIPDALFSNEDIYIKELSSMKINASSNNKGFRANNFHKMKEYFENISYIEVVTGEKFKSYSQCTKDTYIKAVALRAYYEHKPLSVPCPKGVEFRVKVGPNSNLVRNLKIDNKRTVVVTDDDGFHLRLNGKEYSIPYIHHILNSCTVAYNRENESQRTAIVKYDGSTYLQYLSDKTADEAFPEMKLQHD